MSHILSIYQKMGDIAHQIERLEEKKRTKRFNGTMTIGGGRITNEIDCDRMIEFNWQRMWALESFLTMTPHEVRKVKDSMFSEMCSDCRLLEGIPCERDFLSYSVYKTLEVIV